MSRRDEILKKQVAALEADLQSNPNNAIALLNMGQCRLQLQDESGARTAYESLKSLDADLAQQLLDEIEDF